MDEGLAANDDAGVTADLDRLIPELTPLLWNVARAAGLSREDAEDAVQTAWLSLVSHRDSIRTPGALKAWLITTTQREAWRVAAVARRQQPADHEWLMTIPDPLGGSDERVLEAEEHRVLWRALRTLSPRCQQLLRIVAFVPRPDYDLVADWLGTNRGSVGPTRGRCLEKLRRALRAEGGSQ